MSSRNRKRKFSVSVEPQPDPFHLKDNSTSDSDFRAALHLQAYEATVIRTPQAGSLARSLEVSNVSRDSERKTALIAWRAQKSMVGIDADDTPNSDEKEIWIDRYDARLLLDAPTDIPQTASLHLPSFSASDPGSPGGWSDLPSDSEDTFFLTPIEAEDYHREKRRRLIERSREERLAALQAEEECEIEDSWGGSDEEPDETVRELMRRTASHLFSSPNPAQLEMRILANHGSDGRFAFLRGRYARSWRMTKMKLRNEKEEEERKKKEAAGLGGLLSYGESEGEEEGGEPETPVEGDHRNVDKASVPKTNETETTTSDNVCDEAEEVARKARRARAKEWSETRRATMRSHTT